MGNPAAYEVNVIQSPEFQRYALEAASREVVKLVLELACDQIWGLTGIESCPENIVSQKIQLTLGAVQPGNHQTPVFIVVIASPIEGFVLPDRCKSEYPSVDAFFEDLNLMLNAIGVKAEKVKWDIEIVDDHDKGIRTITVLPPKSDAG